MKAYKLYLDNAADNWENASPVGNGAAGMMIYGGVAKERIALNEESIWSGDPIDMKSEGKPEKIKYIRQLFLDGLTYEANKFINENMGEYKRVKAYEYAGELYVQLHEDDECENYRREIDLTHGVCTVTYDKNGVAYKREYFASMTTGLLCAKYTSFDKFSAVISFRRENTAYTNVTPDGLCSRVETAFGEHPFVVHTRIVTDGKTCVEEGKTAVKDATYAEVYTAIAPSFKYDDFTAQAEKILEKAAAGWDVLYKESTEKYASFMTRSDISFDKADPALEEMPVSARLQRLKDDPEAEDPGLLSLYWQFGKYLLVGSSNPYALLPANLQGVWANGLTPPWNSDYHTNINLQMNYWHAEQANIGDCTAPLFAYMNNFLLPGGKKAAEGIYGTRGLVVHHLSDIYQFAAIADGPWGLWPLGGAWMAFHMWEHYLYTNDVAFLRETAYGYIREAALFWIDNLFADENGVLHTGPSTSPENRFIIVRQNGEKQTHTSRIRLPWISKLSADCLIFMWKRKRFSELIPKRRKLQLKSVQRCRRCVWASMVS
ncbi:MAG: glycoside hydrolase family 95 protein [Clostridia bacterium]|nr:glycoside hydrolase family 95 protein [Clostridia bacterium]